MTSLVSTYAGGRAGTRDGHPQMAAFCFPAALACAGEDVWVAEGGRPALRRIAGGVVETAAAGRDPAWPWAPGMPAGGLGIDEAGALWIAGWSLHGIVGLSETGAAFADQDVEEVVLGEHEGAPAIVSPRHGWASPLTSEELARLPAGALGWRCAAIAPDGTAWFVGPDDAVTFTRPELAGPQGLLLPMGRVAVVDGALVLVQPAAGRVVRLGARGGLDIIAQGLAWPAALVADSSGLVVIVERDRHRVVLITPDGALQPLAGDGPGFVDGPGPEARFERPCAIAISSAGDLLVVDQDNHALRKIELAPAQLAPARAKEPSAWLSDPGTIIGRRMQAWRWEAETLHLDLGYARAAIAGAGLAVQFVPDVATGLDLVEGGPRRLVRLELTYTTADGPPAVRAIAFEPAPPPPPQDLAALEAALMQEAPTGEGLVLQFANATLLPGEEPDPAPWWTAALGQPLPAPQREGDRWNVGSLAFEAADGSWSDVPAAFVPSAIEATYAEAGGGYATGLVFIAADGSRVEALAPSGWLPVEA